MVPFVTTFVSRAARDAARRGRPAGAAAKQRCGPGRSPSSGTWRPGTRRIPGRSGPPLRTSPTRSSTSGRSASVDNMGIGSDFDGIRERLRDWRTCGAIRDCSRSCPAVAGASRICGSWPARTYCGPWRGRGRGDAAASRAAPEHAHHPAAGRQALRRTERRMSSIGVLAALAAVVLVASLAASALGGAQGWSSRRSVH